MNWHVHLWRAVCHILSKRRQEHIQSSGDLKRNGLFMITSNILLDAYQDGANTASSILLHPHGTRASTTALSVGTIIDVTAPSIKQADGL